MSLPFSICVLLPCLCLTACLSLSTPACFLFYLLVPACLLLHASNYLLMPFLRICSCLLLTICSCLLLHICSYLLLTSAPACFYLSVAPYFCLSAPACFCLSIPPCLYLSTPACYYLSTLVCLYLSTAVYQFTPPCFSSYSACIGDYKRYSAGIFKQSMGARKQPSRNRVVV